MPRRLRNALGWVAATAAAVAIAHAGVSAVAGRVVDPLPPAVGLAEATSTAGATATPSAAGATGPSGTPDPGSELATSSPTTTPTPADDPPASSSAPRPTSAPSAAPTAAPEATPTSTPSPSPAPAEVRSYALVGGTATLRYEAGRVTVVSAAPAQGFILDVEGDGSDEVTVEFESDDHRSRLRGEWEDGAPRDRVDEDGRSDDDGDEPESEDD